MKTNELLLAYLKETELFNSEELSLLTEEVKENTVKEVINMIVKSLEEKITVIDTTPVNRSKGDIRNIKEIDSIVKAISNLEYLVEKATSTVTPELKGYITQIKQSIFNLRDHSTDFKEAYRDRKTLMILKYQSIVLSIFSSVAYLISVMIDFSEDDVEIISKPHYEEIAPIRTLIDFNRSIEMGEYKKSVKSVLEMEQFLTKADNDDVLLEASDIITTVLTGIKSFYKDVDNNVNLTSFLYKAAGVVTLVMSLREIFYTLYRARTKFSEVISSIDSFASISNANSGILSRLNQFASKFKIDSEESTRIARREIEAEDKSVGAFVKSSIGLKAAEPSVVEYPEFDF